MNSNERRAFKDTLYEQFSRITKALANPRRLELIDLLAQGEHNVEDLARELSMSVANTSQHLQTLKTAQLVAVRRDGLYVFYRLASDDVFGVWQAVRDLGQRQFAEIDRVVDSYLKDRATLEAVSLATLKLRLETDNVIALDVRPSQEYKAGHIPGARSIPLDELEKRLNELPNTQAIVAYCRGPYCVFSDEAVALLNANGFNAHRLEQGFADWQAAGFTVEN